MNNKYSIARCSKITTNLIIGFKLHTYDRRIFKVQEFLDDGYITVANKNSIESLCIVHSAWFPTLCNLEKPLPVRNCHVRIRTTLLFVSYISLHRLSASQSLYSSMTDELREWLFKSRLKTLGFLNRFFLHTPALHFVWNWNFFKIYK